MGVNSVKFHPDGTCVASGSQDKNIKIFDIRSNRLLQHYDAHNEQVNSIAFHPSGKYLISTSNDATLKVWDLRVGSVLYTLYGHEGASTCANFSPCGDYFASAGIDSVVMIWKSNLSDTDHEVIEDLASASAAMTPNNPPPTTAGPRGGAKQAMPARHPTAASASYIATNRSRYQNLPDKSVNQSISIRSNAKPTQKVENPTIE